MAAPELIRLPALLGTVPGVLAVQPSGPSPGSAGTVVTVLTALGMGLLGWSLGMRVLGRWRRSVPPERPADLHWPDDEEPPAGER